MPSGLWSWAGVVTTSVMVSVVPVVPFVITVVIVFFGHAAMMIPATLVPIANALVIVIFASMATKTAIMIVTSFVSATVPVVMPVMGVAIN